MPSADELKEVNSADSTVDTLSEFRDIHKTPLGIGQENKEVIAATAINLNDTMANLLEQELLLAADASFQVDGALELSQESEKLGCLDISFDDEKQINKKAWLMLGSTGIFSTNSEIVNSIPIKIDLDQQSFDLSFETPYTLKEFTPGEEKIFDSQLCFSFDNAKLIQMLKGMNLLQDFDGALVIQYLAEKNENIFEKVQVSEIIITSPMEDDKPEKKAKDDKKELKSDGADAKGKKSKDKKNKDKKKNKGKDNKNDAKKKNKSKAKE